MADSSFTSVPSWFAEGHLRDDLAKQFQRATSDTVFMCTLKKPQLDMRTETSIRTNQGAWFLASGMITWVGEETKSDVVNESNSLFWTLMSSQDSIIEGKTLEEKRQLILLFLGSIHGQRMKSISRLSQPCVVGTLPIANNAVGEISYKFDDNMYFPWVVEGLRVLGAKEIESLPPLFYEYYEGCPCPRCHKKTRDNSA